MKCLLWGISRMSHNYELINNLPKYYRGSYVMRLILQADEAAVGAAEDDIDDTDKQCLIATATDAISRWENIFGIPNSEESIDRRRERLLAKKRGGGTGTIEHLKNVLSSFSNGDVEITEKISEYATEIEFVGVRGVPPYMDDVRAAIEEIIPAHIAYSIKVIYNTWSDIAEKNLKWSDIAGKTWKQLAEGAL